jgi:hypothetical protein
MSASLMATLIPGAIHRIREHCAVIVETPWPELFQNNPHVDFVTRKHLLTTDRFIDPHFRIDVKTVDGCARQMLDSVALRSSPFWDMNARDHRENLGKWRKQRQKEEELLMTLHQEFNHPVLYLNSHELRRAEERVSGPYITIDPSPNGMWKTHRFTWPRENFQKVRDAFPDHRFVQVGDAETPLLNKVVDARGLPVRRTASVLANGLFLVAGIGPSMHLNKAVGKRGAIICGGAVKEDIVDYDDDLTFFNPKECSPCFILNHDQPPCPNKLKCLKEIDPGWVSSHIREELANLTVKHR